MIKDVSNRPQMVTISRIEVETSLIKTFYFSMNKISERADPGQFLMVWIPEVDEIPLSISEVQPELAITVKKVGDATEALHALKVGDRIGVRGPYGNWFSPAGEYPLLVGGGIGMAPILFLIRETQKIAQKITIINGAQTKNEIVFLKKLQDLSNNGIDCIFVTDDGSFGAKGLASTIAIQRLEEGSHDHVYSCGPERMLCELLSATDKLKIPLQACLERLMKCGIGLCGQCCLDPLGYRVCVEGPVFNSEILRKISDFGECRRDFGGRKVSI